MRSINIGFSICEKKFQITYTHHCLVFKLKHITFLWNVFLKSATRNPRISINSFYNITIILISG